MVIMLITVDFEKMIEDDHEHCCGAEEEGEGVEGGVGDHFFFVVSVCFLVFLGGVRVEEWCGDVRRSGGLVWWWWWIGVVVVVVVCVGFQWGTVEL